MADVNHEAAVKRAAVELRDAIAAATAAGYRILYPGRPQELGEISISETAKVKPYAGAALKPAADARVASQTIAEGKRPGA